MPYGRSATIRCSDMNVDDDVIFGARPSFAQSPIVIKTAPRHARWRSVRPKPDRERVRARRAEAEHDVRTAQGKLRAHGGDYIVTYSPEDQAVVRADVTFYDYPTTGYSLSIQSWSNQ